MFTAAESPGPAARPGEHSMLNAGAAARLLGASVIVLLLWLVVAWALT